MVVSNCSLLTGDSGLTHASAFLMCSIAPAWTVLLTTIDQLCSTVVLYMLVLVFCSDSLLDPLLSELAIAIEIGRPLVNSNSPITSYQTFLTKTSYTVMNFTDRQSSICKYQLQWTPIDRELITRLICLTCCKCILSATDNLYWLTWSECFYTDRHKHSITVHPQTSCCKMTSMHSATSGHHMVHINFHSYVDCGLCGLSRPHHHCTHRNCSYGHTSYLYSYRQDLTCTGMSYDHNYSYDVYSWGREQSTS